MGAWDVFMLFLIPFGGGIPAGVLLGQKLNVAWPIMMGLYFISDIVLACVFEPLMLLVLKAGKHWSFFAKLSLIAKESTKRTMDLYGTHFGPLALIMISFGVDPMTGRAVTKAAGHGFVTGWLLAITGDMFYFTIIMASTLWLSGILGDGTATTAVILVLMLGIPVIVRKIRSRSS